MLNEILLNMPYFWTAKIYVGFHFTQLKNFEDELVGLELRALQNLSNFDDDQTGRWMS